MIQRKNYLIYLPVLGLLVSCANPCFAASKSATIQVSCTILPSIEMSSSPASQALVTTAFPGTTEPLVASMPRPELGITGQNNQIYVNTNLGKNYRVAETMLKNSGNSVKLYSVTAL